jgi:hypothetical protein
MAPVQPRQMVHETPISKITSTKWTGGMAKGIECLLCKHEVLSSNSRATKKKKKKKKKERKRKRNVQITL